jgi:hypothetical protein
MDIYTILCRLSSGELLQVVDEINSYETCKTRKRILLMEQKYERRQILV